MSTASRLAARGPLRLGSTAVFYGMPNPVLLRFRDGSWPIENAQIRPQICGMTHLAAKKFAPGPGTGIMGGRR
jgi:hypothetical protein